MGARRVVQINDTTSSTDEDIMLALKAKSLLASDTTSSFTAHKFILHCTTDTDILVDDNTNYQDLREDLVDGLFKFEIQLGECAIKSLKIKDTGIAYFAQILY